MLKIASALGLGIAALVLALMGLSDSSAHRVSSAPEKLPAAPSLKRVVVALHPLSRGEALSLGVLDIAEMRAPVPTGAFSDPLALKGAIALHDLAPGQIVLSQDIVQGPDARPSLAVLIPRGMRAVALRVTDEVAVGNFVRPGDRVDIQLILPEQQAEQHADGTISGPFEYQSRVLLENVEVLTVGTELSEEGENKKQPKRMHNITVAVSGDDALLISLAKERGHFYLALRHPLDEEPASKRAMRITDLVGGSPNRPPPRKQNAAARGDNAKPNQWVVEVFRGGANQVLSSSRRQD